MQKRAFALVAASAAICFSGMALAEETTTGTWTTTAGPAAMTDAEMDSLVAGTAGQLLMTNPAGHSNLVGGKSLTTGLPDLTNPGIANRLERNTTDPDFNGHGATFSTAP